MYLPVTSKQGDLGTKVPQFQTETFDHAQEFTPEARLWNSVLLTYFIDIELIVHRKPPTPSEIKKHRQPIPHDFTLEDLESLAEGGMTRLFCDYAGVPFSFFIEKFKCHRLMHEAFKKDHSLPVIFYGKYQAKFKKQHTRVS